MIFYRFFHDGVVFFNRDQDLLAHQAKDVFRRVAFGLTYLHSEHVQCQNGAFWDFHFGHDRLAQLWIKLRLSASLTEVTSSRCFTLKVPDRSPQGTLGTVTLFSPSAQSSHRTHGRTQPVGDEGLSFRGALTVKCKGKGSGYVTKQSQVQIPAVAQFLCKMGNNSASIYLIRRQ